MERSLSALMTRAKLCNRLGLISNKRLDLIKRISEVRNLAAHSGFEVTFGSPELQKNIKEFISMSEKHLPFIKDRTVALEKRYGGDRYTLLRAPVAIMCKQWFCFIFRYSELSRVKRCCGRGEISRFEIPGQARNDIQWL